MRFRLGILGGGLNSIAGYPHFVASQMDKKFKIVSGIFSRNETINRETAEYWGVNTYYNSLNNFFDKEKHNIDAVAVLLPTPDHFEAVSKLINLNIPVICEKPLFSSLEDFKRIEKKDSFLAVTYNYIAYPILQELKNMIGSGVLGNIINVHLEMPQESFLRPPKSVDYPSAWRKKDGEIPGILLDLATHLFSLSYYLIGKKVRSVYSKLKYFSPYNVVDEAKVLFDYEDESSGLLWVSKTALGNRNGLKISIYGTKASAIWIQENPEKIYLNYSDGRRCIIDRGSNVDISQIKIYNRMIPGHPSGFIEALANLYFEIFKALKKFKYGEPYDNSSLIWTLKKEEESFKVLSAIVESAKECKTISII